MTGDDAVRLTYARPPDLTVGKSGRLTVSAQNLTGKDISLQRLTVVLPRGTAADDVLDGDKDSVTLGAGPDWTKVRTDVTEPRAGVKVGIKNDDGVTVAHNGIVAFTVDLTANAQQGKATATVQERSDDTNRSGSLDIHKTPRGFSLTNLHPVPYAVEAGHRVEVKWNTDEGGSTVAYTLHYNQDGEQKTKPVNGVTSFDLWPYQFTLVDLVATINHPPPVVQAVRSCSITVCDPRLTATNLTVGERTAFLAARTGAGPVPSFTPNDEERDRPIVNLPFTADTDGFLLATAWAVSTGTAVEVTLTLETDPYTYMKIETGSRRKSVLLPVPCGARVRLNTATAPGGKSYVLVLDWRPLGTGHFATR
ncbi:hypothetical protein ABZ791_02080 [Streptomyces huasconensis]|uniref:Uncharacterized protein n=1 Tax=Streptomyces huasconensis TaxID=1854574 RepID=A0ABV3LRW1_9ACTN